MSSEMTIESVTGTSNPWDGSKGAHGEDLICPLGMPIPWFPHLFDTLPDIPYNFVPCDGQTLDDDESPFNGKVIPNLNGGSHLLGSNSSSGVAGGSDTATLTAANLPSATLSVDITSGGSHSHTYDKAGAVTVNASLLALGSPLVQSLSTTQPSTSSAGSHVHSASVNLNSGTQTAVNIKPKSITCNWIMRIK